MKALISLLKPSWHMAGAAICAAGALHICATLAQPQLSSEPAFERLTDKLPMNKMEVLPAVAPGLQRLPYQSPDARYAACNFDTKDGAVAIRAMLPEPGWALALYTPEGENVYVAVAQPGRGIDVSLLIVPTEDRFSQPASNALNAPKQDDATLTVAARRGVALLRAPDQGIAYRARNLAGLQRASCAFRRL
jgi:uncharacterized membrane protein